MQQQKPNAAGWIIPAFLALLFLCACLAGWYSQAAYNWLRWLGLI